MLFVGIKKQQKMEIKEYFYDKGILVNLEKDLNQAEDSSSNKVIHYQHKTSTGKIKSELIYCRFLRGLFVKNRLNLTLFLVR